MKHKKPLVADVIADMIKETTETKPNAEVGGRVEPLVMFPIPVSWDIEKRDWPWNKTHGPDQSIIVKAGDIVIAKISVCEVIEVAGNKFVSAHLKECQKELEGFNET